MASIINQGAMKTIRWGRRFGSRRKLFSLISGAAISLLLLALTPHPIPNRHSQTLGHRRIQQEEDDYTAPKSPSLKIPSSSSSGTVYLRESHNSKMSRSQPGTKNEAEDINTGIGHVEEAHSRRRNNDKSRHLNNHSNLTYSNWDQLAQMTGDVPRLQKNKQEQIGKAQETALTALQHGFKLTEGQKKLIEKLSPNERKELEAKVSKVRVMQEKAYLKQLRAKKQIRPRKGGGEEIVSSPQMPVRFPATQQKVHPRDWLSQYKIFLNVTHYPWAKSNDCSNFSINFVPPDTLPTKALASFPSSGNTWIRYLVEAATGMFTGSMYDDSSLTKKGMYGEGIVYNSGMTILQKSHGYTTGDAMKLSHEERLTKNHMAELGFRGVIVIRNPFKALISHRHLDTGGHTGYAPKSHFIGTGWAEFVELKIKLWRDFSVDWLTLGKKNDLHITHYEKVKENPVREMEGILNYLHLPVDTNRLRCLGQHTDGLFKRKPSKNVPLDMNPFTHELKELIYEAIDDVNKALVAKGMEQLPLHQYEFYDSYEAETSRNIRAKRKKRKMEEAAS